jgi:hypothetical protein
MARTKFKVSEKSRDYLVDVRVRFPPNIKMRIHQVMAIDETGTPHVLEVVSATAVK